MESDNQSRTIVVGVTAGIAAYKTTSLVRLLRKAGHKVYVVPTPESLSFVGKTTWEALSGHAVYTDVREHADHVVHVDMGKNADLVIVAPATAHTIARIAHGFADDLLTASILMTTAPVLIAPAMHTEMWRNKATQANIDTLQSRGYIVVGPDDGQLTGSDSGPGRMVEPDELFRVACGVMKGEYPLENGNMCCHSEKLLAGASVAISAGGTQEPLDPVRFIGNRSTGRMGIELANAAADMGADVTLVGANIDTHIWDSLNYGVTAVKVRTAQELQSEMSVLASQADVVIMNAAVSDYRPLDTFQHKIKKNGEAVLSIDLVPNDDILADLSHKRRRYGQLIVGFAAETGDSQQSFLEYGKQKAMHKGCDFIFINRVGESTGFGDVTTHVFPVDSSGKEYGEFSGTKRKVAHQIIRFIAQRMIDNSFDV